MSPFLETRKEIVLDIGTANRNQKLSPFSPQEDSLKKAREIIHDNRRFDMIYEGFKANHTVHAVLSLYKLGAPPIMLDKFYAKHQQKLEPLSEAKYEITAVNYEEFIGIKDSYSSYLKFFDEQVKVQGYLQALRKYIPRIIPGLAGAALHPLIHLGYAEEFQYPLVAAEGLAYAYSYYLPLDKIVDNIVPDEASTELLQEKFSKFNIKKDENNIPIMSYTAYLILEELKNMGVKPLEEKVKGERFIDRVPKVIKLYENEILKLVNKWGLNENNIDELNKDLSIGTVEIFGESYRQNTFDFFLLHGVTGNHGTRCLLPILKAKHQIRLLNVNFIALVVLFLVEGGPKPTKISIKSDNNDDAWIEIFKRSVESLDEHLIKGVRNLYQLQYEYGELNGLFFKPAALAALDIPKNGWNFSGIGYLPKD